MALVATTAQSRVEQYLAEMAKSRTITKPRMIDGESKAHYAWRILSNSLRPAMEIMKKANSQDIVVTHGIVNVRRLNHPKVITDVLYNKNTKEYLTLDGSTVRIYQVDGRLKSTSEPAERFNKLLYATHISLYVGWNLGSDTLLLMNSSFVKRSTSVAPGPILAVAYNENIGEIVASGPGYIASWVFRYGGRCILPRKVTTDGLSANEDRFSILALEDTASRGQRVFAANDRSVAVFNLYTGALVSYKRYLHHRSITALLFYNQLKYLITAAKDGTVKLWDECWNLQVVFIGHLGSILGLSIYPYGSKIMTVGDDRTIRTWSLESCDEVENVEVPEGTHSLGVVVNMDDVFSVAVTHVDLWKFNHVHLLHTRVGESVVKITSTTHPDFPVRCILDCMDSSIRIVSPTTGEVLTTLLAPVGRGLVASTYAIAEDTLFASFEDGAIIKADTCVNPCAVMDEWSCSDIRTAATCLLIYEFIVKVDSNADAYAVVAKRTEVSKGLPGGSAGRYKSRTQCNRTLLLGGCRDGRLCVYNWDSGVMDFVIPAHDAQGVTSMTLNIAEDQLITSGHDRTIKLWRVYPYARDTLALLMTFHVAEPPVQITIANRRLAVAFGDSEMATYTVVIFNLKTKGRFDHGPSDDHLQSITGLTSCPTMKLFASSSKDGTIRIWNHRNQLLRIIQLQTVAKSISFCSVKGDLLLAVGDHVHRIDYTSYMTSSYLLKMASTAFPEPANEKPIPFSERAISSMSHDDVKRLKSARSAFRFTHFVDIMTREEAKELIREKKERERVYSQLEARERELKMIRDGQFQATKKSKSTPDTQQEAFENYLKVFYDRPKVKPPLDDMVIIEEAEELTEKPDKSVLEKQPTGFFPPPKRTHPLPIDDQRKPASRLLPPIDGFIPNSVLVKLLFPQRAEPDEEKEEVTGSRLVRLDDPERLERIRQMSKRADGSRCSSASFEDRVQVLDYSDDEVELRDPAGNVCPGKRPQEVEDQTAKSKLMNILSKSSTVIKDEEEMALKDGRMKLSIPGKSNSSDSRAHRDYKMDHLLPGKTTDDQSGRYSAVSREPRFGPESSFLSTGKENSDLVKSSVDGKSIAASRKESPDLFKSSVGLMSDARSKENSDLDKSSIGVKSDVRSIDVGEELVEEEHGEEGKSSEKIQPSTELPGYLDHLRGRDWFDRHFPRSQLESMAKPWTLEEFILMLSRFIRISDNRLRKKVADSLVELNKFYNITNANEIYSAIYAVLSDDVQSPCYDEREDVAFVHSAVKLLHALGRHDMRFYQELMVFYLEGDDKLKQLVLNSLEGNGLRDASREFPRELESWDAWAIEGSDRNAKLRAACGEWLAKWMAVFKNHIHDSAEHLQKGHGVHGQVRPDQLKGLVSKKSPEHIIKTASSSGVISVTIATGTDFGSAAANRATYMDAINYFCEMAMHKKLLSNEKQPRVANDDGISGNKNTIVSLPRSCGQGPLVRIGDTHTSKCHQKRETSFQVEFQLPPFNYINLPMKKIIMNPFPNPDDEFDPLYDQQPILLMLKTAQKYFVPSRSYISQQS